MKTESLTEGLNTWKCFVRPGVAETGTFLSFKRVLIVELFPTFGYPTCKDIKKHLIRNMLHL